MGWRRTAKICGIQVPGTANVAMDELESRGLTFCSHFGYENAVAILADMNRACDEGVLYEWMDRTLGVAR